MNAVVPAVKSQIIEDVLVKGDLSKLTPDERMKYYIAVCDSVGLNPYTKPFEYINLNGKLTLYALRACTDQLRTIHKVSVISMEESEREGVFIVTAKVKNGDGREDMAKGAVPLAGLKGEALANAMMKAETKAKRRATLSICGLGFLDETEVETIPGAKFEPMPEIVRDAPPSPQAQIVIPTAGPEEMPEFLKHEPAKPEPVAAKPALEPVQAPAAPAQEATKTAMSDRDFARATFDAVKSQVANAKDSADIDEVMKANKKGLKVLEDTSPANYARLREIVKARRDALIPEFE